MNQVWRAMAPPGPKRPLISGDGEGDLGLEQADHTDRASPLNTCLLQADERKWQPGSTWNKASAISRTSYGIKYLTCGMVMNDSFFLPSGA